jgi:hypothetical protein
MAAILPTQGPFSHPIPVAKAALLVFESFASAVLAFAYAAAQSPSPAAANIGMANARRERIGDFILHRKKDGEKKTCYSQSKIGTRRGKRNFDIATSKHQFRSRTTRAE